MQDQLISFETAKLAKEKGLYQESYPCFGDDGKIHTAQYFITQEDKNSYYQISQSLLQKLLRDGCNIFIKVDLNPNDDTYSFYGDYKPNGKWTYFETDIKNIGFKSYEEALEIGLQEGLKLI